MKNSKVGFYCKIKLSDIENKVIDYLVENQEDKLIDFFLADLKWASNSKEREQAFADFFIKRSGKRIFLDAPEDIKKHVFLIYLS